VGKTVYCYGSSDALIQFGLIRMKRFQRLVYNSLGRISTVQVVFLPPSRHIQQTTGLLLGSFIILFVE